MVEKEKAAEMISVIVPAYNAEKTIEACLDALSNQDYKDKCEIIVIDDGSTDSTPELVSKYTNVRYISQKNTGPAAARNIGAFEAKGDIILFTDSDCAPEKNWITEMLKPFKSNPDVVGVKGRYKTKQREITARFVQLEYEDKYCYMQKNNYIDFIDTYSAGFRKEIFLEMGGYDTEFPVACAEDIELSYRLSRKGYKMVFNPNAIVYHIHPNKLKHYLQKKYKFAYWRMVAVKKNPGKIISDSHTPQLMKIQMLLSSLIVFASLLIPVFKEYMINFLIVSSLIFLLTSTPFIIKTLKKDIIVGILSPFLLLLRGVFQFMGVVGGIVRIIR